MDKPPEVPEVALEIVGDRTATSKCDEGYLRVRRYDLRARWRGEGAPSEPSEPFKYDVVQRWNADAVAVLPHFVRDGARRVVLRSSLRPPIPLRGAPFLDDVDPPLPPAAARGVLWEIPAGLVEKDERSAAGLVACAVRETEEEIGVVVARENMRPLGGAMFPSAGVVGELIFFFECEVDLATRKEPGGDGSPLERNARVVDVSLQDALRWCDAGLLPDAKTEIALRRFAARAHGTPR